MYFEDAKQLNTKTKVKAAHTASGVKDTFQEYFLECLFGSYANKRKTEIKQAALDEEIKKLPEETTSPVLGSSQVSSLILLIDAIMIDRLASDFKLNVLHRANLHAFVQVH